MDIQKVPLSPPSLEELVDVIRGPLEANYEHAQVSVVPCPDLRQAPFNLATEGICGEEKFADVGSERNFFPRPQLENKWSMIDIARGMDMKPEKGGLLGAGGGPSHVLGYNCELVPNLGWQGTFENVNNQTRVAQIDCKNGSPGIGKSCSNECALVAHLYGSSGDPGPVLKVTARGRKGSERSFTECIRKAVATAYGTESRIISLGGAFVIRSGRSLFHIMPDFPPEDKLPWKDAKEAYDWLTYHKFDGPITCMSVMHSADPDKKLGLRLEHSHGFSSTLVRDEGGHYHHDTDEGDTVEYEGYFNTAKTIYRIDKPEMKL